MPRRKPSKDRRGNELKFPRASTRPAKRPDHNEALVRVVCEACGKDQKNDSVKCRGCKHPYGTYQLAC